MSIVSIPILVCLPYRHFSLWSTNNYRAAELVQPHMGQESFHSNVTHATAMVQPSSRGRTVHVEFFPLLSAHFCTSMGIFLLTSCLGAGMVISSTPFLYAVLIVSASMLSGNVIRRANFPYGSSR